MHARPPPPLPGEAPQKEQVVRVFFLDRVPAIAAHDKEMRGLCARLDEIDTTSDAWADVGRAARVCCEEIAVELAACIEHAAKVIDGIKHADDALKKLAEAPAKVEELHALCEAARQRAAAAAALRESRFRRRVGSAPWRTTRARRATCTRETRTHAHTDHV